jgi:T5SS/PEP-CTERM-associated repeat protein
MESRVRFACRRLSASESIAWARSTWCASGGLRRGRRWRAHRLGLVACILTTATALLAARAAQADVALDGQVDPNTCPPGATDWNVGTTLSIGNTQYGLMSINDGSTVYSTDGLLGHAAGSDGHIVVDGAFSTWWNEENLMLGEPDGRGVGELTIGPSSYVYAGDGFFSSGVLIYAALTISDTDATGSGGGHLSIYDGSALTNSGSAMLGDG